MRWKCREDLGTRFSMSGQVMCKYIESLTKICVMSLGLQLLMVGYLIIWVGMDLPLLSDTSVLVIRFMMNTFFREIWINIVRKTCINLAEE